MPLNVPYDQADDMTGNGKKINAALLGSAAIAAAMLASSASSNQNKANAAFANAAMFNKKAQDALAGKGMPNKKTVWDMYGDKRGGVKFEEDQLSAPNSSDSGAAGF